MSLFLKRADTEFSHQNFPTSDNANVYDGQAV